ncbi:MAG: hypothetical protein KA715_07565 [Xanthomonadaceae bacterium]|nr:hypothetical protein [Xanthomonadaceae bacterium]
MKPQDIVVLLKILLWQDRKWTQHDLANDLGISQTEINFSLSRLVKSGLLDEAKKHPFKHALAEFLIHGLKYIYPAELSGNGRGMATAQTYSLLAKKLISAEDNQVVWPDPEGKDRGQHLEPLYPSVPFAAKKDPELHEWLALIDAIRIGSVRVQKFAIDRIHKKLNEAA